MRAAAARLLGDLLSLAEILDERRYIAQDMALGPGLARNAHVKKALH